MPIADQAYIRTCGNHVTLHKFKEPVPTSSILILNECECDRKHLVVAINSNCRQYLTFIFFSQESAIDTEYRKTVLKRPDACTKTKEDSMKKRLVLRSYSGSGSHQNGFPDFSPQFWQAYE